MSLFKKKDKGEMNSFLALQSVKPDYVNPEAFMDDAERIVEAYLKAVYSQDCSMIPMRRMEEHFFYRTREIIETDASYCSRSCTGVHIITNELSTTDYAQQFAIKSISYDILFSVTGSCREKGEEVSSPYEDQRLGTFKFLNDQKLGWILCAHEDFGRR